MKSLCSESNATGLGRIEAGEDDSGLASHKWQAEAGTPPPLDDQGDGGIFHGRGTPAVEGRPDQPSECMGDGTRPRIKRP